MEDVIQGPSKVPEECTETPSAQSLPRPGSSVNLRDLASVAAGQLAPGRVHRSSQVVSTAELRGLGVKTVLDLRQTPVLCRAQGHNLRQFIARQAQSACRWLADKYEAWRSRGDVGGDAASEGPSEVSLESDEEVTPAELDLPPPCWRCTETCCEAYGVNALVHHVDLLPPQVSLRILRALPRRLQVRVIWTALKKQEPEPIVAGAVADPTVLGYLRLYIILLEKSKPGLAAAMRVFVDPGRFPVLVHCIHGKDRTGLVSMLLLLLCGVETEAIVKDYARSELLLRESRDREELSGLKAYLTTDAVMASAREVMEHTLAHLRMKYGGVRRYLHSIGLHRREVAAIRRNLRAGPCAAPPYGGGGTPSEVVEEAGAAGQGAEEAPEGPDVVQASATSTPA